MPIRNGFGFPLPTIVGLLPTWLCETCWLSEDPAASAEVAVPVGTRCAECRAALYAPMLTVHCRYIEEMTEIRLGDAGVGVCITCLASTRTVECADCTATGCGAHIAACSCSIAMYRCAGCARAHAQTCPRVLAARRRGTGRTPAFEFLCDSEDESLVTVKHVRPKLSKRELARPRPGVFAVATPPTEDQNGRRPG